MAPASGAGGLVPSRVQISPPAPNFHNYQSVSKYNAGRIVESIKPLHPYDDKSRTIHLPDDFYKKFDELINTLKKM